jgi:hypothetical protein
LTTDVFRASIATPDFSLSPTRKTISNRYTRLPRPRFCGRSTLSLIDGSAGSLLISLTVDCLTAWVATRFSKNYRNVLLGSTRFDGPDVEPASIRIGFTFLARSLWATGASPEINGAVLALSFKHFDTVFLMLVQRTVDQLPQ